MTENCASSVAGFFFAFGWCLAFWKKKYVKVKNSTEKWYKMWTTCNKSSILLKLSDESNTENKLQTLK